MERPSKNDVPAFYQQYLEKVEGNNIDAFLQSAEEQTFETLGQLTEVQAELAYAEGKWTIKDILQHLIDAETVFTYRALWLARGAQEELAGFDHNQWVIETNANQFVLKKLLEDFKTTRSFSRTLFAKITDEQWERSGVVNGYDIKCIVMPYLVAGHNLHHINVIKERYL